MKRILLFLSIFLVVLTFSTAAFAQAARPYRNGSVWSIGFIQIKPGMDTAYLNYVAGDWKKEQETLKKDGQIISYMVIQTEGHSSTDWNLMLMTEFKDLASMEANQDKADQLLQTMVGDDTKQSRGTITRGEMRELMGDRLARQIILEPKK